ncbi:MAG TPA: PAS domain S-box protein, partial [Chitinophaga sp.]|uniref:PAS domain S-box protein n=1 Tax=Chitinophaga sp. TaxID=1869181 RepID=UPI002F95FB83
YTLNDAADVSPERLRKFFMREGDGYRVRREIREMILFANHNFIKDPPFSHLDLVSCRNVLIYLNHSAQERVMETFHFALKPGGFLFLGSSESATGANDLYTLYNREHHIFQSRQLTAHAYPVPESVPTFQFKQPNIPANISEQEHRTLERITISDLHQRLLEQYAPPSLVINEEYEIVHLSERAGRYLQIAGGEPSQNLLKLIRPELRLELRSALYQSIQRQTPVEARGLKVSVNEHTESINIHVRPVFRVEDPAKGFILVVFERASDEEAAKEVVLSSDEPVARQLEEELMRVKVQLRAAIEQHEFHAEELKASNEELQAMNEELRSAAEELETSKEELQSINEELRTVNQELKVKIEETTLANNNLQNLIKSADIGTIFLDRSFRVALFTPSIRGLFNLIPNDIGRPLSDITHRLVYNNLMEDAELVLEKLQAVEHEVRTTDGRLMMMRVLPYRTAEDRINGVVITFFDITERKHAEEALRQSEERYRTLFNSIDEAFALCEIMTDKDRKTVDYRIVEVNPAFEKIMGPDHTYGKNTWEVTSPENSWIEICEKAALNGETFRFESRIAEAGRWFDTYVGPVGEIGNGKFALVFTDISERKRNEISIRKNEARLTAIFAEAKVGLSEISLEGKFLQVNNILCRILGRSREELLTLTIKDVTHPEDLVSTQDAVKRLITSEAPVSLDKRYKRQDGTPVWVNSTLSLLKMDDHNPPVILAVSQDLTERKKAEAALLESERKLATELRNMQHLQQVSSQMILDDNGDVLYNHILDALMSIMQSDMGSIHLLNIEKQALYLLAHTGFDDAAAADLEWIPANTDSIYSWTLNKKNRLTVNISESTKISLSKKELATYEHLGIHVIQSTPLITRKGKVLGVITCYWKNSQALPQSEMHIVDVLARQAADLVERKLAEQALRNSEELFRAIVSQTTVGIYRATLEGELLFVNRKLCEILGYTEAELLGVTTWSLTYADDLELNRQLFKRLLEENAPFEIEKRFRRKDGSFMWASVSAAPIRDHDGSVRYTVAVVLDITERKALEQQREDFIGIASHELKTPVTSIKAYAEVLQELFEESQDLQNAELMKKLDMQVDRLTELINVLLDTTNVAEGKLVLHTEKFDMNRLISEHIEDLQHLSKIHRFVFRRGKLRPIVADREHIGQVLTNLFSNAIKYSPAGGDIIITSEEVDNTIRIQVQDSGIGIPEGALNKVFDRFFRVTSANASPVASGLGLGLYITAGIIHRHGGTIHVTSEQGKGSIFHITLPYANNHPA